VTQQNPYSTVPRSRRSGLLLTVTLIVAVLGLVVGVAGVAVASIALGRSDKAVSAVNSARNAPPPPPPTGAGPAPVDLASADPTTDPPSQGTDGADPSATPTEIDPSAQFAVAYQGQNLTIRSMGCNSSYQSYVDLDEPRILLAQPKGSEFGYNDCDPGQVRSDLLFAQVPGPNATPADCLETIRTDPGRSPVAPASKMTLCFLTSQNAAAEQGISQKLVFVTVNSVTVDNNTGVLSVTVKAWTVPQ
jgi:hypothetical protein